MSTVIHAMFTPGSTESLVQKAWWGYLLANNPLAAILSHITMHIAGVLHGPASVVQLPPHY